MEATSTKDYVRACTDVSACKEDNVSACIDVSTDNKGVYRSMCPYISTKGTGAYLVTSMDKSKVNTFACRRTGTYEKYRRYKPIWDIGTDAVGKLRKEISYADALQQGS